MDLSHEARQATSSTCRLLSGQKQCIKTPVELADRSLLVNLPSQPPWNSAEPLQQSALLGRLQTFLPAMQKANQELEQIAAAEPGACNIEDVAEDEPHIEMNLACGVLDLKDQVTAAAAQKAVNVPDTAEAIQQLPFLKDNNDSSLDAVLDSGVLDMSGAAAGADGNLMRERSSRRIGTAKQEHGMNGMSEAKNGPDGKGTHPEESSTLPAVRHTQSKPSNKQGEQRVPCTVKENESHRADQAGSQNKKGTIT